MNSLPTQYHLITLNGSVLIFLTIGLRNIWITKNLNILPTMEEISLHGKELGNYSNMNHSHLRLCVCVCVCVGGGGGGAVECKVESRSLKLFIPDNTLSFMNILPNTKESKNYLALQFVKLAT